jgi:CubicO group peptidase (beta-lactamase class C family)
MRGTLRIRIGTLALAAAGAAVSWSMAGCGSLRSGPSPADPLGRAVEAIIRSTMRKQRIAGLSAIVVSGDRQVLAAGFGLADRSRGIPVTVDTLFPIASVTKLFTATAVMQLVERGLVDLDAPVSRYLPELARPVGSGAEPTVRDLLTHHSGLTGNIMEGFELTEPDPAGYRQVPGLAGSLTPAAAPGTVFAYCNTGYSLLGCIVERAGGTGYAEAVRRGILEPLGMSRTRFYVSRADAEAAVMGYEGRRPIPLYPLRDIPAGGLLSTAADMERFMRFVFDRGREGVLGRSAFDEMTRRQNAGVVLDGDFTIGLGYWLISPLSVSDAFVSHAGDIPPCHAILVTIPDRKIGVFLAANSARDPSALIPLAVDIVRALYADRTGRPVADPPIAPRAHLASEDLERLAGRYASPLGLLDVRARRGRLLTRINGFPLELVPRADGTLTAELSLLGIASVPVSLLEKIRLSPLEAGGKTYLRITMLGIMAGVAEKLDPAATPPAWKARAGRYAIVRRGANASYRWPRDVELSVDRRSGLLLLTYTFAGQRSSFPLEARSGSRAVIAGRGTGLGDELTAIDESGATFLEWAGLLLRREPTSGRAGPRP